MKTDLITKFLRHLAQKHQDNGFTLIELLVVIVIIGILAAIALPSFLNQANKARQSEAKTYVGAINRAQQAYFIEYGEFGVAAELEGGTAMMTRNYTYNIVPNNAVTPPGASVSAAANRRNLKSYAGIVVADRNQMATVICETITTTQVSPSAGYNIATRTTVCNGNSAPVNQ